MSNEDGLNIKVSFQRQFSCILQIVTLPSKQLTTISNLNLETALEQFRSLYKVP